MAVSVTCPGCRTSYPVTEDLLGKKIRCKKCQETFTAATAKSAAGARGSDERITTRPPVVKAVGGQYADDDDDDAPQRNGNGHARPMPAKRPAKKGGNGLLIGAIAGGVLLVAIGTGLGVWLFSGDADTTDAGTQTATNALPIAAAPPPKSVSDVETPPKKVEDAAAAKPKPEMRTADAPDKLEIVRNVPRPADFRPDVIERVKKSAAFITVTTREGGAWGSGWIAERHRNEAYVVTNSHVVGMKEPAKPPPEKVDVCLDAGLPTERHYDARLLALDREEDLAVLHIKGRDLPDPLKIAPSYDLQESQRLMTMGFPLGGNLVKRLKQGLNTGDLLTSLKARGTSVSGRIFNKDGSVKYIQVEGGADQGNSGGAAVDTNGNLVAVVVAQEPGTNMKFIIPSEYVIHLLLGRVQKVIPGQAVGSAAGSHQPIVATIADPLKRLRSVDAEVWVGPKPDVAKGEKPVRAGGDRQPKPIDGDGPRAVATLTYDPNKQLALGESHTARAELTLPPVTDSQVYWFQPHYHAKDGTQRWGEAIVLEMGRFPVEAKPAHLAMKLKEERNPAEARRMEIDSRQVFGYTVEDLGTAGSDQGLNATLTERVLEIDKKSGDAKVRLQYLDLRLTDNDTDTMIRKQLKGVMESVKGLGAVVTVTKDGKFKSPVADFANVPQAARPILKRFNEQVTESLEVMALSLPGKDLKPGDTWDHGTAYTFALDKNFQNALLHLTCKYVGTRVRDGRAEAVIEINGTVAKGTGNPNETGGGRGGRQSGPGSDSGGNPTDSTADDDGDVKLGFHGVTHGAAVVDIVTGLVTLSRTESDLAVVFPVNVRDPETRRDISTKVFAGLYLDIILRRSLTKDAPKAVDVAALLPNQPRAYNPLVGVGAPPDASLTSTESIYPEQNTLMPKDVWDKVKRSAVMISVDRNDGGGEGSGWFAEPGIIVTNCHVVGMLNKADRPPEKITVYLDRGTDTERKLDGELLAINREDDLAVVRVKANNLPEPMKITPSAGLVETNRLSVLGFPNGTGLKDKLQIGLGVRDLMTTLKSRPTTVSGRVYNADHSVKYVQFEGGADHGNSGGAVVDAKGEVRAVLVAGFDGTELRWGIPSEHAARMIQGWPLEILPGRSYMDGSTPKQPIDVRFTDPMGRLKSVAIEYWLGNPGKPRKPTEKKPEPGPGDGPRKSVDLSLKTGDRPGERFAAGEFVLPDVPTGQVCWLQVRFTNGTGQEQWSRGIAYAPDGPPVERKPVVLAVKHKAGTKRDVELTTFTNLHTKQLGRGKREGDPFKVALDKGNVLQVNKKTGTATVNLEYQSLELDLKKIIPGLEEVPREVQNAIHVRLRPFLNLIRGVITVVEVKQDGHMNLKGLTYGRLPPGAWAQMHQFNTQIFSSLQAVTFPLPGKEVPYGYTWEFPTNLFIVSAKKTEAAVFKMKFKYLGVRDRGGRQEAIVEIGGSLAGDPAAKALDTTDIKEEPGQPETPAGEPASPNAQRYDDKTPPPDANKKKGRKGLYGVANGYAFVDVRDGFVAEVKLFIDLDVEMTVKDPGTRKDVPVDAGGTMELLLRRRTTQTTK